MVAESAAQLTDAPARPRADLRASALPVPKARQLAPDLVRAVATYWVILIHISAVPTTHFAALPAEWWWWAVTYNATSRAAVPLFIMVSGALLLAGPSWTLAAFARRRAARVLVPLIAWNFLYIGWRMILRGDHFTVPSILRHVAFGMADPVYPHLWFLYLILGLYLAAPILRPFVQNGSLAVHLYFIVLWLVVQALRYALEGEAAMFVGTDLSSLYGCLGYFVLGAIIERHMPARLPPALIGLCLIGFSGASVAAVLGTHIATSRQGGVLDEAFLAPLAPDVIAMSLSAYLLIRHVGVQLPASWRAGARAIGHVGGLTYGVYLIHPMIIDVFDEAGFHLDPMPHHPGWYVALLSLGVLGTSVVAASALRRTKLAWLMP